MPPYPKTRLRMWYWHKCPICRRNGYRHDGDIYIIQGGLNIKPIKVAVNPCCVDGHFNNVLVVNQGLQKAGIDNSAVDMGRPQGLINCAHRGFAVMPICDDFSNHRVIKWADLIAGTNAVIDPLALRKFSIGNHPRGRQKPCRRVFGIDAGFYGVAIYRDVILADGQGLTACDKDLPFNKVITGDHFGDGVFNLQPRIHFHKPKLVGFQPIRPIGDKFNCSCTAIIDGFSGGYGGDGHGAASFIIHSRSRGFLDDFLMSPLKGAVTFKQMHGIAHGIGKYLNFNMARFVNTFFQQYMVVTKAGCGFAFC